MDLDREIELIRKISMQKESLDVVNDNFISYAEIYSKIQDEKERISQLPKGTKVLAVVPKDKRLYENYWQKVMYGQNEGSPIVIYGAGKMGNFITDVFVSNGCNNIVALCDNGTNKPSYQEYPIIRHDECMQKYPEAVYVITVQQKYIEIIDSLLKAGIPRSRITVFDRLGNRFIYNP